MITVGSAEARSFLLNDVTASEREHFEEQILLDDAFFAELTVVEDDLLEEFARGELEEHEARRLERRVDRVQEWQPRIAFSRALAAVADGTGGVVSSPRPVLAANSLGVATTALDPTSPADSLSSHGSASSHRGVWVRWGTMAATVALALAATWFASLARTQQAQVGALEAANARLEMESVNLESRLNEGLTQLASLESALEQRSAELEQERAASTGLQEAPRVAQNPKAGSKAVPSRAAQSLTFVLGLTGLRSETSVPSLVIAEGVEEVRLQLDLEGDTDYSGFQVRISNDFGEEIWSQDGLALVDEDFGAVVQLTLPADLLLPGRYDISASGHRHQGGLRDVGFYALEIAAR
ncbi:MAG: hypothetical protein K8J08_10935 [Thermoanaerobaculia bacterium]|nr:hypothetical protein [Thermoanaerobaculia bacterium]